MKKILSVMRTVGLFLFKELLIPIIVTIVAGVVMIKFGG